MTENEKFVRSIHPDMQLVPQSEAYTNVWYDGHLQSAFTNTNRDCYFEMWANDIREGMIRLLEKSYDQ